MKKVNFIQILKKFEKFVLSNLVKDYEKAEAELNETVKLSQGKSWNIKEFLPEEVNSSNTLYMNANYLLHLCYMRQAKSFLKSDLSKALDYAIMAKKKAAEGIRVFISSTKLLNDDLQHVITMGKPWHFTSKGTAS